MNFNYNIKINISNKKIFFFSDQQYLYQLQSSFIIILEFYIDHFQLKFVYAHLEKMKINILMSLLSITKNMK